MWQEELFGELIIGGARIGEFHPHRIMVNPIVKPDSDDGDEVDLLQSSRNRGADPNFGNLIVKVFRTIDDLDKLCVRWDELLAEYPQASIFSSWEWLTTWWRAFGADQQLHVLAFEDGSSRLVGLAPLALTTRESLGKNWKILRLMGDGSGDSDNLDLVVAPGYAPAVVWSFLTYLEDHSDFWDFCELNAVPANSPAANVLMKSLAEHKWVHELAETPCCQIPLPGDWDTYFKQLSSTVRKNFKYHLRRLEKRLNFRIYRCSRQSDLPESLTALFDLHQKRWRANGDGGSFSSEKRRVFYQQLSSVLQSRNWLEFWILEIGGKPIAADYGFRYKNVVYALQAGFDPSEHADSPGFCLKGVMLRALIESGVQKYDFLAGFGQNKAQWNAQLSYYQHVHFARRRSLGGIYLRTRSQLKSAKERLREHLPVGLWKLLHRFNAFVSAGAK
jgi:CelD/BcsL family acetyltransferase involved in cellulose biosynthesis